MQKGIYLPSLALLFMLACALPAAASNFSYSHLEISLERLNFDERVQAGSKHFDVVGGLSISGSYQFTDTLYVTLDSTYLLNEESGTEFGVGVGGLSLGAAFAVADATDIFVQLGTAGTEQEVCNYGYCIKENENAIILGAGVRHLVSRSMEIRAAAAHTSARNFGGNFSIGAETRWWVNDGSSLHVGLSVDENSNTGVSIGYRYTFNWAR